jgi:hypothetical protein
MKRKPFTYRYPVDSSVPTHSAIAAPILREGNGVKHEKVNGDFVLGTRKLTKLKTDICAMSDENSAARGGPGGQKRSASSPITNPRSSTGLNTKVRS